MEEVAKRMKQAAENIEKIKREAQAKDQHKEQVEWMRLAGQYEDLQQDPTLATSHPPITREDIHKTRQKKSRRTRDNKEITLVIHFHGAMIMNNTDENNQLVMYNVETEKELYILDNCNPGKYSQTKTSRVIPLIEAYQAEETELLTQHIKNEYALTDSTMSDLVKVETYIEKVYTDDDPVHDAMRLFHEKFRIMYIHSREPRVEIEYIENFIQENMEKYGRLLRSELMHLIFIVMGFEKMNLYDFSCSGLVDPAGHQINKDPSRPVGRFFYSTQETDDRAIQKQRHFNAKGQSRKHKSRKHKSRKHNKSRKHKSRKDNKSRK